MGKTYNITIPTFHPGQTEIYKARSRRNVVRCGRRFGKTKLITALACNAAARGKKAGVFTPEHKQWLEPYDEIYGTLHPVISRSNKSEGILKTITAGQADFWHLTDNPLAGRGREYDLILIDEAAFTKNGQMVDIWHKSIVATTATRPNAEFWIFSTPNGEDTDNFFWKVCNDPQFEFKEFHQPSWTNPLVSMDWVEAERSRMHPDVFRQEIKADWVSWDGVAFFEPDKWMVNGKPVAYPERCDYVFAIIDTAAKTGTDNDGTAVAYFARSKHIGYPLVVLDWELEQIQGALLEHWLPNVFRRLKELAAQCGAIYGEAPVFIEDKSTGTVLLQQAMNKGLSVEPIDSKITSLGKDERAMSVSGYHYNGQVKISEHAYNKVAVYKGEVRNHFASQIKGFRIGDKKAATRADDLLDTYTYGLALSLGNQEGF